jgi:transcriptional regulator with XRE-family HTH domain
MPVDLNERNREIASILREYRRQARRTVSECAAHVGTTRRRYTQIEAAQSYVTAVELEELVRLLQIPPARVWPAALAGGDSREVSVQARPGERVEIVVRLIQDT